MAPSTRKSTRVRFLTSKAKHSEETSKNLVQPSMSNNINNTHTTSVSRKPVLRSISTVDDNENTYNNLNFKRRKLQNTSVVQAPEAPADDESEDEYTQPNFRVPDDFVSMSEEEFLGQSEDDNLFNSDDDNEYYSAISDYESDNLFSKPTANSQQHKRFISHSKAFLFRKNQDAEISRLAHVKFMQMENDNLFESDESESETGSPINSHFHFADTFGELKSLEENFKKIIDENHKSSSQSTVSSKHESLAAPTQAELKNDENITIDDFVDYTSDVVSSDEDAETTNVQEEQHAPFKSLSKHLHYRHDEKHNLAFPDVSTFPIRYDPSANNKKTTKKSVRALNRRAILTGMASEMVGTGMAIGEFNIF